MSIYVNGQNYSNKQFCRILTLDNQQQILRLGRVVVSYKLSHNNVSELVFSTAIDDGIKKPFKMFLQGKGSQSVDALFFETITTDANFEVNNVTIEFVGNEILNYE